MQLNHFVNDGVAMTRW